jgi:hypothetical protein
MILERRQVLLAGVALSFLVLLIAAVVVTSLSTRHQTTHDEAGSPNTTAGVSSQNPSGWRPVTPATALPTDTPVQQQYDQALASGMASSSSIQVAESAPVPTPAFSSTWPALPYVNTPEQWSQQFTQELLDIDFAHQSRAGLGSWLSGEEAPELLPGVPADAADKVLYLSLFDTAAVGGDVSPIPDARTWQADGQSGVHWLTSNLLVQPDPKFSQIVADGWQPTDERFTAEDVSGLLTVTDARSRTTKHFSMTVYLGSARWHQGYGTVLVDNWRED